MTIVATRTKTEPPVRDKVVEVLELLSTRMQWSAARALIANTSLHTSRGWTETIATARNAVYNESVWTDAYNTLSNAAGLHTYVSNKRVSFFDLSEQNIEDSAKVLKWAPQSAVNDLSRIVDLRPFSILNAPTTNELLEPYKDSQPQLIAADVENGKLFLQFFSARSYFLRESLDISKMSSSQQKVFAEYDELIGVKTKFVPCFDTVVIDPTADLIEIRVDFQPGMIEDKKTPTLSQIISQLNRITASLIGHEAIGTGLINLYPAINPLYRDDKCGQVTALGFVATGKDSSSNNRGQIHRTKSKDFRKDEFHVGGKNSVEKIDPYAIGITWQRKAPKSDLYLELKGSVRTLYTRKLNSVTVAEIVGCLDEADFSFVTGQVLSRLKRRKK